MLGCGGRCGKRYERKVCGGGEGGDVGKCRRKCVGAPHLNTLPYTSPIPLHANMLPHSPHTLSHTSFLTHSNTLPYTSPHSSPHLPLHPNTLPHIFPHSLDYVAKLPVPCDDVTLITLAGLWKSPIKFFTTTGNLKSCFGVGNVNFQCMKVWRSYWQPPRQSSSRTATE